MAPVPYAFIVCFAILRVITPSVVPGCLTWVIDNNHLKLICRIQNSESAVSFKDGLGQEQAKCVFKDDALRCVPVNKIGNIMFHSRTKEISLTLPAIHKDLIDGQWTCSQGEHEFKTNVTLEKGIISATDIILSANVDKSDIKLTCFSCREPLENHVEFMADFRTIDEVFYSQAHNQCMHSGVLCQPGLCSCSASGNEFSMIWHNINNRSGIHFSCEMNYSDRKLSSKFSKMATIFFNGKDFYTNKTKTTIKKLARNNSAVEEIQIDNVTGTHTKEGHDSHTNFNVTIQHEEDHISDSIGRWIGISIAIGISLAIVVACLICFGRSEMSKIKMALFKKGCGETFTQSTSLKETTPYKESCRTELSKNIPKGKIITKVALDNERSIEETFPLICQSESHSRIEDEYKHTCNIEQKTNSNACEQTEENEQKTYSNKCAQTEESEKKTYSNKCNQTEFEESDRQAQTPVTSMTGPYILNSFPRTFDLNDLLPEMAVLDILKMGERLVITGCSKGENKLFVINTSDSSYLCHTLRHSNPWKITEVDVLGADMVALSYPKSHTIEIINISTGEVENVIHVSGRCYALSQSGENLCLIVERSIQIVNLHDGSVIDSHCLPSDGVDYICPYKDGILFTYINALYYCDYKGAIHWEFKNEHIMFLSDVATDSRGYIYVTTAKPYDIILISSDGKEHQTFLQGDALMKIHFDMRNNCLLVFKRLNNVVSLFDINFKTMTK
ncbi:uncharacterized protein LOC127704944 isoform X2 [Mytilus californianus]|uniref:uncharacterized protein LOC127704944 isoform X2 n=1 Tax=Mytilus californianus TaxID=6549 RepID=UPI0022451974|nr:uncharacterized protein LOC127704944 isoform X2 [Mytilus californianus]